MECIGVLLLPLIGKFFWLTDSARNYMMDLPVGRHAKQMSEIERYPEVFYPNNHLFFGIVQFLLADVDPFGDDDMNTDLSSASAFDRAKKRLQKSLAPHIDLPLHACAEVLAQSLGARNAHEAAQYFKNTKSSSVQGLPTLGGGFRLREQDE